MITEKFNRIKTIWIETLNETTKELHIDLAKAQLSNGADSTVMNLAGWIYLIIGLLAAFLADGLIEVVISWYVFAIGAYVLTHLSDIDKELLKLN